MSERILIIDQIKDIIMDGEVVGKECFDKTRQSVKVKRGKGGGLEKRWDELLVGRAYSFTMELFQDKYPFVADFKSVESQFVKQAQEKVVDDQFAITKRSVCLSYAKDLVDSDNIMLSDVIHCAELFYRYITGHITLEDEQVILFQRKIGGKDETVASKDTKGSKEIPDIKDRQHSGEEDAELGADDRGGGKTPIKEMIDLDWLQASLKELKWTGVVAWMKKTYEITEGKTVREILQFMNELQKADFLKTVKDRLEG